MRNLNSGNFWKAAVLASVFLTASAFAAAAKEDRDVVYKPLKFGGVQEFGSIVEGVVANDAGIVSSANPRLRYEWVDHFGTFLSEEVIVDKRLNLQVGLGGVFEFPKPEHVIPKYGSSMYKMFFVGPSVAKAVYTFGNLEKPVFTLGGGLFPYKYNTDAVDLGEYLFRTTPYPATIFTGGLLFVNDNAAYLQGLHARLQLGDLTVDGLLATETSLPPLYDWSLGIVADYQIANGLMDVGAGVNFKRLIQVKPSKTQREIQQNAYFIRNGKNYYGDVGYYKAQKDFYAATGDSVRAASYQSIVDSVNFWMSSSNPTHIQQSELNYYTPAGVILMARASLDLKKIISINLGDAPFKIFTEAAILGWKDYPIFYEDKWKRAPVMMGIHLPTFGLLDQLTLQFEYFNSPWSNNTYNLGAQNVAVPYLPAGAEPLFSKNTYNDVTQHDNNAWVVLLRRQLYPHLNLSAQFARDHMRTVGTNWFYGGRLEPSEVLYRNSNWYWMAQLGWSL